MVDAEFRPFKVEKKNEKRKRINFLKSEGTMAEQQWIGSTGSMLQLVFINLLLSLLNLKGSDSLTASVTFIHSLNFPYLQDVCFG